MSKISQLQIRVSPEQKARIRKAAQRERTDMSSWVLSRLFPSGQNVFHELTDRLAGGETPSLVLAELNDFLDGLSTSDFSEAVASRPSTGLSPYLENYVAAMVELSAARKNRPLPAWLADIAALEAPRFGAEIESLRLHLLTQSPPPFRRRNIFIDASIGDRV